MSAPPPVAPPLDDSIPGLSVGSGLTNGAGAPYAAPPAAPALAPSQGSDESKALVKIDDKNVLPSLEPALSNIQPIPIKKTLMVVNSFVVSTTDFVNKFSVLCERKLNKISQSIQRLEIILNILEAKLDSIPWMAGAGLAPAAPAANGAPAAPPIDGAAAPPAPPIEGESKGAPPPPSATPTVKLQDDERYVKFFKMMKMGVPKDQLRVRLAQEGLDPDVVDMDPEGPAPEGGSAGGGSEASNSTALVKAANPDDSGDESD